MDIQAFTRAKNTTIGKMSRELRMDRTHLWSIATGRREASFEVARRIEDFTDGLVTPNDLSAVRRAYLARAAARQAQPQTAEAPQASTPRSAA